MKELQVGVSLPQFTSGPQILLDGFRRAEAAGLDSVWLFDHLWPLGRKDRPLLECWSTLAWLAARSERMPIGTLVTRSSLRHPALLAKMAATVAEIASVQVTIGIGSGDNASRPENEAFGIPYFAGDERVDQLVSTVQVMRRYLTQTSVTHHDAFASIEELPASPHPQQPPRVWVGGRSEAVLEVAGTEADGWNAWGGTPEDFAASAGLVLDYAGGRAIELSWGGQVIFGATDEDARDKLGSRDPAYFIAGAPETVAAHLQGFVDAGARHLVIAFPEAGSPGAYETLAGEVVPRLSVA